MSFRVGDRVKHIQTSVSWQGGVVTATPATHPWQVVPGTVRVRRDGRDTETDGVIIPVNLLELEF